jgi:SUKH-3 immunity protein
MTDQTRRAEWSELTYRVLRSTAWHPGRAVPVDDWESALRQHGFDFHDAARRFLREFGGLRTDTWTPGPVMPQSPFRFDPRADATEHERFARFSAKAGADLCPIGVADSGESFLGMTAGGSVYIGRDHAELLADTASEAIEKLVMERRTDAPLPFVLAGDHLVFPPTTEQDFSAEIGPRWSAETGWALRQAGWHPGRSVPTAEWERTLHEEDEGFVMHEAARGFLAEFGGMTINVYGPGRTMSRAPIRLDPLVAKWDFEIIDVQSEEMGTCLYPLGDTDRGNAYLTMDTEGAVYMGMDYPRPLADSGDAALSKLIEGVA